MIELSGGQTRRLARFSRELQFEDLPSNVVEQAKRCILDTLGCSLGGSTLSTSKIVLDLLLEQGVKGEATVLGKSSRKKLIPKLS